MFNKKNNTNIIINIDFKIFDEDKKASTGNFLNKRKIGNKEDPVSGEKQRLEKAKSFIKALMSQKHKLKNGRNSL